MEAHPIEILLVDDNRDDIELALMAFKRHHFSNRVQVVHDGEEALEYIFAQGRFAGRDMRDHPRVILLDLKMPKVSGLEVLEKIRADARTRTIPVVVLTSSKEERDIIDSYNLGVNSYIVKPVDFEKFVEATRMLSMYWLLYNEPPR